MNRLDELIWKVEQMQRGRRAVAANTCYIQNDLLKISPLYQLHLQKTEL